MHFRDENDIFFRFFSSKTKNHNFGEVEKFFFKKILAVIFKNQLFFFEKKKCRNPAGFLVEWFWRRFFSEISKKFRKKARQKHSTTEFFALRAKNFRQVAKNFRRRRKFFATWRKISALAEKFSPLAKIFRQVPKFFRRSRNIFRLWRKFFGEAEKFSDEVARSATSSRYARLRRATRDFVALRATSSRVRRGAAPFGASHGIAHSAQCCALW